MFNRLCKLLGEDYSKFIIKKLEDKNLKQPIQWSFIDFKREILGHPKRNVHKFKLRKSMVYGYDSDQFIKKFDLNPEEKLIFETEFKK